jgi:hypothetical protein
MMNNKKRLFCKKYPVTLVKIFITFLFLITAVLLLALGNYSNLKLVLFFGNIISIASIWFFDYMFLTFHKEKDHGEKTENYYIKGILIYYSLTCVIFVVLQSLYV